VSFENYYGSLAGRKGRVIEMTGGLPQETLKGVNRLPAGHRKSLA